MLDWIPQPAAQLEADSSQPERMVFRTADPWIALLSMAEFELSLAFVVLVATFALALFIQRPFCRYACPLGAIQAIAARISPITVQRNAAACAGCDLCNRTCPMAIPVNTRTRVTDTARIGCLDCVAAWTAWPPGLRGRLDCVAACPTHPPDPTPHRRTPHGPAQPPAARTAAPGEPPPP